jgi:hypothetical protein
MRKGVKSPRVKDKMDIYLDISKITTTATPYFTDVIHYHIISLYGATTKIRISIFTRI